MAYGSRSAHAARRAPKATPPFATLDCETDPFARGKVVAPFAWGLLSETGYRAFWGVGREREVADAIGELPAGTLVYAHNGGRFDAHFLAGFFEPGEITVVNGRLARVRIRGRELRDSWLLIPAPLASSGMKAKMDFAKHEAAVRERHKAEILDYLRADCEALYALVAAFYAEHGESLTLAGAAVKAYARITGAPRPRLSLAVDQKLRGYYFGGRCQAFALGELAGPWRVYDVNSAYPWAMTHPHPAGIPSATTRLPERPEELALTFATFDGRSRGVLPVREPGGGLTYPDTTGTFRATGHELLAGLDAGDLRVDRVRIVWRFPERLEPAPFVAHYWAERQRRKEAGDVLGALVAKVTMNSLYGKLGQTVESRERVAIADANEAPEWIADGFRVTGTLGPWLTLAKPNPSPWALLHVGAAASITGQVRAMLWRALRAAREPVYCDTDSVICRELGAGPRIGDALGAWKIEAVIPGTLAIAGKKLYAGLDAEGRWKMASKGAALAPETIVSVARGVPARWESDAPTFTVSRGVRFIHRTVKRT